MIILLFSLALQSHASLLCVIEICRHGARSPVSFIKQWDNSSIWPEGPGELLASGMRQHYILGSILRNHYIDSEDLLSPSYNNTEIFVFSSDFNRTLMSAQSQLQGLYPEGTGEQISKKSPKASLLPPISVKNADKINEKLKTSVLPHRTQLIPIHTDSIQRQFALNSVNACHYYKSLVSYRMKMNTQLQKIFSEYSDVISTIQAKMGYTEQQAQLSSPNIIDSLIAHKFNYGNLPFGFNSTFLNRGEELVDRLVGFFLLEPDLLSRFAGTALMNFIVNDLKDTKVNGRKFVIYSAHDSTLSSVLGFLEQDYSVRPPFASVMLFELHDEAGELYVKLKYNGKTLDLAGVTGKCPFVKFQEYVGKRSIQDYYEKCKEDPSEEVFRSLEDEGVSLGQVEGEASGIGFGVGAGLVLFAGMIAVWCLKYSKVSLLQESLIPLKKISIE